ncbi:MAG TPA: beta-ketoacyl-ACP synthase III [Terriglobales bacterium]|nr:beta-ketoacyl-ACP synthase III [Terriglobales bacterium]
MAVTQAPRVRSDAVPLRTYRSQGRPTAIAGIGVHVPDRVVTNHDLEQMVDTSDKWIVERTGIRERRVAEPGTPTFEMAARAALAALAEAETRPQDLDMILVATSTPDGPFPSVACRVQNELGIAGCCAMDVLAACSGFAYALSLADAYIASGRADTILVIGAEVLTRLVDWTDRGTCVLFADGAGAAVVRPARQGGGFRSWCLGADGRGYDKITCGDITKGAYVTGEPNPRIGMKGPDVFKFATDIFIRQAHAVAAAVDMTMDDIDLWVPHQANSRIIEAAAHRVGLPMERVMVNIDRYGNTSTATIPLALHDALEQDRLHPGDTVLIAGFGSGLTWAACLLEWE